MQKINEEIKQLLFLNYHFSNYNNDDSFLTLSESHGLPDDVLNIVEFLKGEIKDKLLTFLNKKESFKTIIEKELFKNKLAKKIEINIQFYIGDEEYCYFGYNNKKSIFNEKENIFDVIVINGICSTKSYNSLRQLLSVIAHELTHAFEDLNRRKHYIEGSGKPKDIFDKAFRDGYNRLNSYNDSDAILSKLANILYCTQTVEQHAYIAQIIMQIKLYLPNCSSSKEAWKILNDESPTWQGMLEREQDVYYFLQIKPTSLQNKILEYWNNVTGNNITEYNIFCKALLKRWKRFKKKLITNLSKQITDMAFKNPNWIYL